MDRENLQSFIRTAETELSSVRSSLLIVAQTGDASDLATARRSLALFRSDVSEKGHTGLAALAARCEATLDMLAEAGDLSASAVYSALDDVVQTEAALFSIPMHSDDFLSDVAGFVDASFDEWMPHDGGAGEPDVHEGFEIDEETLEIFRFEAEELLGNIADNLRNLSRSPGDQKALWEIRRNAHTFKGAAGIVGIKDAASIAHRMEDLLDKMVEMQRDALPFVIDFLDHSAGRLNAIVSAKNTDDDNVNLQASYENIMAWLESGTLPHIEAPPPIVRKDASTETKTDPTPAADAVRPASVPIVRVSLDRLDELIRVSRGLMSNRSALADKFTRLDELSVSAARELESILEIGRQLTEEMHARLMQIRMVKFGTLETRLSRAVNVTCQDENKKAAVELVNGDVEVDTQMIDALIEPLLHLLKNAVVHGIESPDTRRLIGKPERGTIRISLEAGNDSLVLAVNDDGGGISLPKLREKALAAGILDAETAGALSDRDAFKLIFDRGLTTADKIDLNAGRGVGMSIVKESVESHGGTVLVESEPRRGTTFTIIIPLTVPAGKTVMSEIPVPAMLDQNIDPREPLVLVVDDSPSIRRQMTIFVEKSGFRSTAATNGAEALELLLSGSPLPDLILSDVEMPQMDGWQLLEHIKSNDKISQIPVVLVTSLDADSLRERAFGLGATGYVVKPFRVTDLEKIVTATGIKVAA